MTALRSSSTPSSDLSIRRETLRRQLDTLARRGERRLFRHAVVERTRAALGWSLTALGAGPAILALWQTYQKFTGQTVAPVDWAALLFVTVAGPIVLLVAVALSAAVRHRNDRTAALALFDRELPPGDRLRTSDEFLRSATLDNAELEASFKRAAIDAHQPAVVRALAAPTPHLTPSPLVFQPASLSGVLVAAALAALLLNWRHAHAVATAPAPRPAPSLPGAAGTPPETRKQKQRTPPVVHPSMPAPTPIAPTPQRSAPRRSAKNDDQQSSEQSSGHGSQSNASDAAASAASQATPQKPAESQPESPKKNSTELAKPEPRRTPPKPRNTETAQLAAQADSGHGRSPSSSNNPPSPFDQPEVPDRAGALPDRDVEAEGQEDEDEQQKADQASQPMRNQPVADVDRNLSPMSSPPGPESEDPPNGRGGPGDIKKSRGVPSMILGIPVPDRVPGVPGAGRTKVTQEFAQPTPESHPAVAAETHAPRSGPVGAIQQPELSPWRRQLLERYFQYPRNSDTSNPTDETSVR